MRNVVARLRAAIGPVLVAAAIAGSAQWLASAQPPANALPPASTDAARFTGASRALDPGGLRISHRWFEAGARSAWHRHVDGQLLFVQEGRARVQKRGGPMREMGVGESDYTGPNVDHWHGATPDTPFVQVAVGFSETTEWLEHVTDAQYAGR